ncbi:unnamed protein product, partial [marine sediment metagenome]
MSRTSTSYLSQTEELRIASIAAATPPVDGGRGVKSKIIKKNINPFRYCKKEFEKSDLNIANLECVISDQSNREKPFSELLRVPAGFVNILRDNNIHVVNVANNHALDHGIVAFNEMIDVLNNNGIRTFGYSLNKYFQDKPLVINIKRTKLGFIGYNLANLSDISDYPTAIEPVKKRSNILYIGRMIKEKGIFEVLKIANLLKEFKFVFVGEFSDTKQEREFKAKLQFLNNVEWIGPVYDNKKVDYI